MSVVRKVFALFHCERRVCGMLLAVLVLKTLSISVLGAVTIRKFKVGDACLTSHIPFSAMLIRCCTPTENPTESCSIFSTASAIELGFQTTLWCLTLYKHIRTHLEHGWQDIPLLSLITRDGSWAFALLLGLSICLFGSRNLLIHSTPVIYVALLKDTVSAFIPIPDSTMRLCDISFPSVFLTTSICYSPTHNLNLAF